MNKKAVWKYILPETTSTVLIPKDSKILTVQAQFSQVTIWALINDTEAEKEERKFQIIGTGKEGEIGHDLGDYIGTFQMNGGMHVFHVFEVSSENEYS